MINFRYPAGPRGSGSRRCLGVAIRGRSKNALAFDFDRRIAIVIARTGRRFVQH